MLSKLARSSTLNSARKFKEEGTSLKKAGDLDKVSLATKTKRIDITCYIKVKIIRKLHSSSSRDLELQNGF